MKWLTIVRGVAYAIPTNCWGCIHIGSTVFYLGSSGRRPWRIELFTPRRWFRLHFPRRSRGAVRSAAAAATIAALLSGCSSVGTALDTTATVLDIFAPAKPPCPAGYTTHTTLDPDTGERDVLCTKVEEPR